MSGAGVVVVVLALVALAPWWIRGDAAQARAASIAQDGAPGAGGSGASLAPGAGGSGVSLAPGAGAGVDAEVVLALVAAACRSGASVVRALDAVGAALAGPEGEALRSVASVLVLGGRWDDAWPRRLLENGGAAVRVLREALRPAWEHGPPPEPALRAASDQLRRDRAERSATAAGRLGVRLVLPLGLCYLPAFVLVGLVPVLVSYGVGLLGTG